MITVIATLGAAVAALFLGLRAQMLKGMMGSWPDGPPRVRRACFALSVISGGYVVAVLLTAYRATQTEAVLFAGLAFYATEMWLNLHRQGVKPAGAHQELKA